MINNFEDMQKLGQSNVDGAMRMFGEWNKNWQAIAAEMGDYTKRSLDEARLRLQLKKMGRDDCAVEAVEPTLEDVFLELVEPRAGEPEDGTEDEA